MGAEQRANDAVDQLVADVEETLRNEVTEAVNDAIVEENMRCQALARQHARGAGQDVAAALVKLAEAFYYGDMPDEQAVAEVESWYCQHRPGDEPATPPTTDTRETGR